MDHNLDNIFMTLGMEMKEREEEYNNEDVIEMGFPLRDGKSDFWDVNRNFSSNCIRNNSEDNNAVIEQNVVEMDDNSVEFPNLEFINRLLNEENDPQMNDIANEIYEEQHYIECDDKHIIKTEYEENVIAINQKKSKRGRKSLISLGMSDEQIQNQRRTQNKISQQKKRDRKKLMAEPIQQNPLLYCISSDKICLMESLLSQVRHNITDESDLNIINCVIKTLTQLPLYHI